MMALKVYVKKEYKVSDIEKYYLVEVVENDGIIYEAIVNSDEFKRREFTHNRLN